MDVAHRAQRQLGVRRPAYRVVDQDVAIARNRAVARQQGDVAHAQVRRESRAGDVAARRRHAEVAGIDQPASRRAGRCARIDGARNRDTPARGFDVAAVAAGRAAARGDRAGKAGIMVRPDDDRAAVTAAQRIGRDRRRGVDIDRRRARHRAPPQRLAPDADRAAAGRARGVQPRALQSHVRSG